MTPEQIIKSLNMFPNDAEGGYLAPVYNATLLLDSNCLPGFPKPIGGDRPICGDILYFLHNDDRSVMHRVVGDMVYHFYGGDPVQMLLLKPDNTTEICTFSNDLANGGYPMKAIPGGTWLGSRLIPGGINNYALMGVTMAPGFNPADYEIGKRSVLVKGFPDQGVMIMALTNDD